MVINTKYNIGEEVLILSDNSVKKAYITSIGIDIEKDKINITYCLKFINPSGNANATREESKIYKNIEDIKIN